ncbi:hypothetical protein D3C72_1744710 [compost metagenome]
MAYPQRWCHSMALPPILTVTNAPMKHSTRSQWNNRVGRSHTRMVASTGVVEVVMVLDCGMCYKSVSDRIVEHILAGWQPAKRSAPCTIAVPRSPPPYR